MYTVIEYIGVIVFAVSGAMVAIERKMDLFGVMILGATTATGGGIMRDLLLGNTPPYAFKHPIYVIIALAVSAIVFLPKIRKHVDVNSKSLIIFDSLGLGVFTVVGCNAALAFHNPWMQVCIGVITAVGGGVLRDIFAAQMPMIFVRHIYAVPCIVGAIIYTIIYPYNEEVAAAVTTVFVFVFRILAAKYKWHFPKA